MTKLHLKRLEKLADFLYNLPKEKFNFGTLMKKTNSEGCGTVCCAIGWTPVVFPKLVEFINGTIEMKTDKNLGLVGISNRLFGTIEEEYNTLFEPTSVECPLFSDASSQKVAKGIRKFIAKKTKEPKRYDARKIR